MAKYKPGDEVQCFSNPSLIDTAVEVRELFNSV